MRRAALLLALILLGACASYAGSSPKGARQVLIFSHTTGYRHESIEPGKAALKALVEAQGARAVLSEDPEVFAPERLRDFAAIIFLSTTTDPKKRESEWLTGPRAEALQGFVRSGGGIVGIHAAADSHYFWPWYGRLIGGKFQRHPPGTPSGRLTVVDPRHPSTRGLPVQHERADEWYYYDDFDPTSRLLVTLDPASIGEPDANPNPISWTREIEGGRVFYTALGHTSESYSNPYFLRHVAGGLHWTLAKR